MSDSVACARAVVGQLVAQGVTEFVLAPGSRSAPLALAAEAAARAGLLRLHVRVDERVAGFLALGLAKASGRCVPVVTTSGTAVGNLLPAVMEAHHAGVPLLVVSADRPAALVGSGANQTTDQAGLFGGFVRHLARISSAAPPPSWAAQAARAVLAAEGALSGNPGPAQANIELGLPLVPAEGVVAPPAPGRPVRAGARPAPHPLALAGTPRTVVVCGDATPATGATARRLAEAAGLPLVAEPSSNARSGPNALACGRLLLAGPLASRVERVVVFGRPTLSRPVSALLAREEVEVVVVAGGPDYVDPGWRAGLVAADVTLEPGDPGWLDEWRAADAAAAARVAAVTGPHGTLAGPELARLVVGAVPAGEALFLASSSPVRDADLAPVRSDPPLVLANRGLAGIDGTVSSATGAALALGRPVTLLCGDLAFGHDAGALAIGGSELRPDLRVVVADDRGGSIFAGLEYGQERFATAFERVFATPTGVDPVALAAGYGVAARRLSSTEAVRAALAIPVRGIEVLVVDVDRSARPGMDRRLQGD